MKCEILHCCPPTFANSAPSLASLFIVYGRPGAIALTPSVSQRRCSCRRNTFWWRHPEVGIIYSCTLVASRPLETPRVKSVMPYPNWLYFVNIWLLLCTPAIIHKLCALRSPSNALFCCWDIYTSPLKNILHNMLHLFDFNRNYFTVRRVASLLVLVFLMVWTLNK
jgi:hypothetical protein